MQTFIYFTVVVLNDISFNIDNAIIIDTNLYFDH